MLSVFPQAMPNADRCQSMPIKIALLIPMPNNKDQCPPIGIDTHIVLMPGHWHLALIERVLCCAPSLKLFFHNNFIPNSNGGLN